MKRIRKSESVSDTFHGHNINVLSVSSINTFIEDRAKWCMRYILKLKDKPNPKIWRGRAVEAVLTFAAKYRHVHPERLRDIAMDILHREAQEYLLKEQGEINPEFTKNLADAEAYIDAALPHSIEKIREFPVPQKSQKRYQAELGVELPFVLYPDIEWTDLLLDFKTTDQMPAKYSFKFEEKDRLTENSPEVKAFEEKKKAGLLGKYSGAYYDIGADGYAFKITKKGSKKAGDLHYLRSVATRPLKDIPEYGSIRDSVKRQIALYSHVTGKPAGLFFAGKKEAVIYNLPADETWPLVRQVELGARSIRRMLMLAKSREEIIELCTPNFDSFYWDEDTRAQAEQVWGLKESVKVS